MVMNRYASENEYRIAVGVWASSHADCCPPKKKVIRKGRELTVVIRPVEGREATYFFRGAGKPDDAVEVE
jgi:hypothetical protein